MKKGFTLVELLAVVVILGVLSLLVTSAVGTTITSSKNNLSKIQINKIEEAAKTYYIKEGMLETEEETNVCINIKELIEKGYIDNEIVIDTKTGEELKGSVEILYISNHYTYKYKNTNCLEND